MMMKKILLTMGACTCIPHILLYLLRRNTDNGKRLKMDVKEWLRIKKHSNYGTIKGLAYLLLKQKEFRNLYYHRMGLLSKVFGGYLPGRSTLFLFTPSDNIGGGFYIGHGWSTVVNACQIGEHCLVAQNSTIGSKDLKTPVLGDNVKVWSHSVILGGVVIGSGTQIGSGSVVVKNVPENCVVIPSKSVIIKKDGERVNILL